MKKIILRFFILAASFALLACGTSGKPQVVSKNSISKTDGDSFDTVANGGDLVIHTAEEPGTLHLEGRLVVGGKMILKFAKVQLVSPEHKLLSETASGKDGRFAFAGVYPKGNYVIQLPAGSKFRGQLKITVADKDMKTLVVPVDQFN